MPEYVPNSGLGPILRGIPNIGQDLQDREPQLAYNNWFRGQGLPAGFAALMQQLFPQVLQQYFTDESNVYAPSGQREQIGPFGAKSLMAYGTGQFSDDIPIWEWLNRTTPHSLYSMLTGRAAPGGQQQDLGFRKSRF